MFVIGLVLASALVVAGCRSGGPDRPATGAAPQEAAMEGGEDAAMAEPSEEPSPAPAPAMVSAIEVREGAPGSLVELTSDEPLVWTSFRDADGNVVVELPNTVAPDLGAVETESDVISSLRVEEDLSGARPLTRLVAVTRGETEHSVRADGTLLTLEIVPMDQEPEPSLAFEPIAEEEAPMEAPDEEPAPVMEPAPSTPPAPTSREGRRAPALGTPEQPVEGPEPTGVPATRLRAVHVDRTDDLTVVEITGDGEFTYSTFRLGEPERFVIDLEGVVNQADRAAIPVGSPSVERVRVGQFRPFPEPVSRVVFDLNDEPRPHVERTPESLIVRFGAAGGAAEPAETMAEERPAPEPAPSLAASPAESRMAREPMTDEPMAAEPMMDEAEPEEVMAPPAATPEPGEQAEPAGAMAEEMAEPDRPIEIETPSSVPSDAAVFGAEEVRLDAQPEPEGEDGEGPVFGARTVSGEREYFGEPIDMTLKDADVVETLRSFARISGLNIVIQPDVSGRVTVELHNVPWDQALEQILKINGLGYEVEGNIMRIARLETLSAEAQQQQQLERAKALSRPLQTIMKRLSYTNARNVARVLAGGRGSTILSQRASVIVDDRTNTLIISELPEYMDTVLAIIDNLDEPEPQVMIEARIIETTKRFSRTLGVAWGFDLTAGPATGNSTGLQFPNNLDVGGSVNLPTGGQNGLLNLRFGNILNTFQLDAVLNAAEEDGLVNILSTPKVATLNNHQATIQSGVQVPIQTVANNTVTVQFVNATLRLEVTPQITADGTVVMDIRIQKREVQTAFLLPGATNAPISTKEAQTQVLVRDGGTAVIGGIYEVSTDQSENRVPGLANIPILGHLFRNRDRSDENEELLIFITPRVVRL
ncbi:MAG: type IV pilus secretin PilQ [Acidobacteriota bacterium]